MTGVNVKRLVKLLVLLAFVSQALTSVAVPCFSMGSDSISHRLSGLKFADQPDHSDHKNPLKSVHTKNHQSDDSVSKESLFTDNQSSSQSASVMTEDCPGDCQCNMAGCFTVAMLPASDQMPLVTSATTTPDQVIWLATSSTQSSPYRPPIHR